MEILIKGQLKRRKVKCDEEDNQKGLCGRVGVDGGDGHLGLERRRKLSPLCHNPEFLSDLVYTTELYHNHHLISWY